MLTSHECCDTWILSMEEVGEHVWTGGADGIIRIWLAEVSCSHFLPPSRPLSCYLFQQFVLSCGGHSFPSHCWHCGAFLFLLSHRVSSVEHSFVYLFFKTVPTFVTLLVCFSFFLRVLARRGDLFLFRTVVIHSQCHSCEASVCASRGPVIF